MAAAMIDTIPPRGHFSEARLTLAADGVDQTRGGGDLGRADPSTRLGEVPDMAFNVLRAIGAIAVEFVLRVLCDLGSCLTGAGAVLIDIDLGRQRDPAKLRPLPVQGGGASHPA
jgi:hypothetical protein